MRGSALVSVTGARGAAEGLNKPPSAVTSALSQVLTESRVLSLDDADHRELASLSTRLASRTLHAV